MKKEIKLEIKRMFDAPIELVWQAWTEKKFLDKWFAPEGLTTKFHEIGRKEGDSYRVTMYSPDGKEHTARGIIKEFKKPSQLSYTWAWDDENGKPGQKTLITFVFKSVRKKTEMTFTHSGFSDTQEKDFAQQRMVFGIQQTAERAYITTWVK